MTFILVKNSSQKMGEHHLSEYTLCDDDPKDVLKLLFYLKRRKGIITDIILAKENTI